MRIRSSSTRYKSKQLTYERLEKENRTLREDAEQLRAAFKELQSDLLAAELKADQTRSTTASSRSAEIKPRRKIADEKIAKQSLLNPFLRSQNRLDVT